VQISQKISDSQEHREIRGRIEGIPEKYEENSFQQAVITTWLASFAS
jgi:hypothetical protein